MDGRSERWVEQCGRGNWRGQTTWESRVLNRKIILKLALKE
jgi:hypothetical protein